MKIRQISVFTELCLLSLLVSSSFAQEVAGNALPASGRDGADDFALLAIGVTQYENAPNLKYTASDAVKIAAAYRDVGKLAPEQIHLFTDHDEPLTQARFLKACQDFYGEQSTACSIFFFSGHGYRDGNQLYLVTSDFDPSQSSKTGVEIGQLRTLIANNKSKLKIVLLDCCFSGGFGDAHNVPGDAISQVFRSIPGCVAIAASSGKQESIESDELKSGVFTYWLNKGLRGAANRSPDNRIDVTELFEFLSAKVRTATQNTQTPTMSFDQADNIPTAIPLNAPDRPSDSVGIIPFVLPPSESVTSSLLDAIEHFVHVRPRRAIGAAHWILKHSPAQSASSKRAQALIDRIDELILKNKLKLGPIEDGEIPRS